MDELIITVTGRLGPGINRVFMDDFRHTDNITTRRGLFIARRYIDDLILRLRNDSVDFWGPEGDYKIECRTALPQDVANVRLTHTVAYGGSVGQVCTPDAPLPTARQATEEATIPLDERAPSVARLYRAKSILGDTWHKYTPEDLWPKIKILNTIIYEQTLGEYTDFEDSTGATICEDDILEIHDLLHPVRCVIIRLDGEFQKSFVPQDPLQGSNARKLNSAEADLWTIIGNVFDNPELIINFKSPSRRGGE